MTRDEAIGTQMRVYFNQGIPSGRAEAIATDQIDSWVALGILKLDEPKAPYEILAAELGWADTNTRHLKATLDRCGLCVVAV